VDVVISSSHRLTAIEGLEGLTELRELYLSHNVIEDAQGLESQARRAVERSNKEGAYRKEGGRRTLIPGCFFVASARARWSPAEHHHIGRGG